MVDCGSMGEAAGHHLPTAFHVENVVLFGVLSAAWRGACGEAPFWGGALFAWHPLHVESVAGWRSAKDVLSAFFWM